MKTNKRPAQKLDKRKSGYTSIGKDATKAGIHAIDGLQTLWASL